MDLLKKKAKPVMYQVDQALSHPPKNKPGERKVSKDTEVDVSEYTIYTVFLDGEPNQLVATDNQSRGAVKAHMAQSHTVLDIRYTAGVPDARKVQA